MGLSTPGREKRSIYKLSAPEENYKIVAHKSRDRP
jgi:hypothetical protein